VTDARREARTLRRLLSAGAFLFGVLSCSDDGTLDRTAPVDTTTTTTTAPTSLSGPASGDTTRPTTAPTSATTSLADALCRAGAPEQIGALAPPDLDELSGHVAVGGAAPVLWAVEDSGNDAALFALDATGAEIAKLDVDGRNIDWESIAAAPDGTLYVGDIGDNLRVRDAVTIYVVAAPDDPASAALPLAAATITVRYPDGPHDAEALFADPIDGHLYVVTKALDQTTLTFEPDSIVYRFAAEPGTEVAAEEVARLRLGATQLVTAADVAVDGSTIALRTYGSILVWARDASEPVASALARDPCVLPGPADRIGESIAFLADGSLVTTSEGVAAPLWRLAPVAG
jgi:hypothetical protein